MVPYRRVRQKEEAPMRTNRRVLMWTAVVTLACTCGIRAQQNVSDVAVTVPLTAVCAEVLERFARAVPGPNQPRVRIVAFGHTPRELDHIVGYAEVTFPNADDDRPQEFFDAVYRRCSASFRATVDTRDPAFGSALTLYLERYRKEGAANLSVRLKGETLEVYGTAASAPPRR
jgi:hypothetical protein